MVVAVDQRSIDIENDTAQRRSQFLRSACARSRCAKHQRCGLLNQYCMIRGSSSRSCVDQAVEQRSRALLHSVQVHSIDIAPLRGAYFIFPWMSLIWSKCFCITGSAVFSMFLRSAFWAWSSARLIMSSVFCGP